MSRSKGTTKDMVAAREALECATAALVRVVYLERITRLRIEQARARCGLGELLDPALTELHEMMSSVRSAQTHVGVALRKVVG